MKYSTDRRRTAQEMDDILTHEPLGSMAFRGIGAGMRLTENLNEDELGWLVDFENAIPTKVSTGEAFTTAVRARAVDCKAKQKRRAPEAGLKKEEPLLKPSNFLTETLKKVDLGAIPFALEMPKGVWTSEFEQRNEAQKRLLCDKRIADLYWIHKEHRKTLYSETSAGFRKLFEADEFDLELADKLVKEKKHSAAIIDYAGLQGRYDIQLELCSLRELCVYEHHKNSKAKDAIRALVYRHNKRADDSEIEKYYSAYLALRLSQGSLVGAVRLGQLTCTHDFNRDQLKRKKTTLGKWLGSSPGKKPADLWKIS